MDSYVNNSNNMAPGDTNLVAPPQPVAQFTPPQTAMDTETLETAWLDAIEKSIEDTIDDPYMLNNTVAALRRDYSSKRYGKDLDRVN